MSKIGYCPRGEMQGIVTTEAEQIELKNVLEEHYIDHFIPLPDVTPEQQKVKRCTCDKDHDSMEDAIYWENETGAHGWCCSECGEVLQWG